MENKLNKIRKKIDSLDDSLIKLLYKRSYLINEAGKVKKQCHPKISFARETLISYALQKKDFGLYNTTYMQKIWRELISASLLIEGNLNVEVFNPSNTITPLWVLARDHFGTYCNIINNSSLEKLISNINSNITTIGVIPFPNPKISWWNHLIKYPKVKVNLTLPFLPPPNNLKSETGIVISKSMLEHSVDDSSLFLIQTNKLSALPNIKIISSNDNNFLVILNGFTKSKDLVSRFTNIPVNKIYYLGSYPKPMFS